MFQECVGHIKICEELQTEASKGPPLSPHPYWYSCLQKVEQLIRFHKESRDFHGPIIIKGSDGCGKSSLLSSVFTSVLQWLEDANSANNVIRIVRYLGRTPGSVYAPTLIQSLFCQITLACSLSTNQIHPNMELSELCYHLQNAVEMVANSDLQLVVVIDDLQELRNPTFEELVMKELLPWKLPSNIHVLCSINSSSLESHASASNIVDILQNNPLTKDNLLDMSPQETVISTEEFMSKILCLHSKTLQAAQCEILLESIQSASITVLFQKLLSHIVQTLTSNFAFSYGENVDNLKLQMNAGVHKYFIKLIFLMLESRFGKHAICQVAQLLTCTLYGLTEVDLLHLLGSSNEVHPTFDDDQCSQVMKKPLLLWYSLKSAMSKY